MVSKLQKQPLIKANISLELQKYFIFDILI